MIHPIVLSTLSSLNVNFILGERLDLGFTGKTVINEQGKPERIVRTQSGREIRAELVVSPPLSPCAPGHTYSPMSCTDALYRSNS